MQGCCAKLICGCLLHACYHSNCMCVIIQTAHMHAVLCKTETPCVHACHAVMAALDVILQRHWRAKPGAVQTQESQLVELLID